MSGPFYFQLYRLNRTPGVINWKFDNIIALPDWSSPNRTLGCHLHSDDYNDEFCWLFNAQAEEVAFDLMRPLRSAARRGREVDMADANAEQEVVAQESYRMVPYSLVMLSVSY